MRERLLPAFLKYSSEQIASILPTFRIYVEFISDDSRIEIPTNTREVFSRQIYEKKEGGGGEFPSAKFPSRLLVRDQRVQQRKYAEITQYP